MSQRAFSANPNNPISNVAIISGDGTPEASIIAPLGTLYQDMSSPGTFYVKSTAETLNTGWVSFAASAFSGASISTPQALSGTTLGAISLTTLNTTIVTTGAATATLAAGTSGQRKVISMITDGGDCVVTVTNFFGSNTTITLNDAGDVIELLYINAKWTVIVNTGCTLG